MILKCFFKINLLYKNIEPKSFYPKPKINSSIIEMIPKKDNIFLLEKILSLKEVTKCVFLNKRKKIKNNLCNLFNKDNLYILNKLNIIDFDSRAESLSIDQFCKLTDFYIYLKKNKLI